MCKMLFIGTKSSVTTIPYSDDNPDFFLEPITNEFFGVSDKFQSPHIYFVGTSRGCSCDFSIRPDTEELLAGDKLAIKGHEFANSVRELFGVQQKWLDRKRESFEKLKVETRDYERQTRDLLGLLDKYCTLDGSIEMFCCWAGEYGEPAEEKIEKAFDIEALTVDFDVELNEFVTFEK